MTNATEIEKLVAELRHDAHAEASMRGSLTFIPVTETVQWLALTMLEAQAAEIARLRAQVGAVEAVSQASDDLPEQLLRDADEMEACGGGNEAANMRKLVKCLIEFRAALATPEGEG